MTKYEELTQAFENSVQKQRGFDGECKKFGSQLHHELIRFLGCTRQEVAAFPPGANRRDSLTHSAVDAMQWDAESTSWRMMFEVRFARRGWVDWLVEIRKVPDAFIVRASGFEDRIDSQSPEGFDAMFARWHGVLIDDFENGIQRMIEGKPPGPSRSSVGFKAGEKG